MCAYMRSGKYKKRKNELSAIDPPNSEVAPAQAEEYESNKELGDAASHGQLVKGENSAKTVMPSIISYSWSRVDSTT